MQIVDLGDAVTVTAAEGDTSTTIADLAMFVEFDINDVRRHDTTPACIAYEALEDEYGAFEKTDGEVDFYNGCWMEFADGSTIRISN